MRAGLLQEFATLIVILAIAILVFWETRHYEVPSGGQISPGSFPRLAAGFMGTFAVLRSALLLSGTVRLRVEERLFISRDVIARPIGVSVAMTFYVFLFGTVPFFPLTLAFIIVVFFIFGVRPWKRLCLQAVVVSTILYLLFSHLLQIAV